MSPRLAFALDAALRAGRSTLAHFQSGIAIETKADASPVTIADKNAERIIREMVDQYYPGEAVLGEEEGATGTSDSRWVIDPIDGTKSFISGVPLYSTLFSYEENGLPILGVVYFPALNELIYAERGSGTFFNGVPCHVRDFPTIAGSTLCCGGHRSMFQHKRWEGFAELAGEALITRSWADAYGHALVATGRADAMFDPIVSRWDLSAVGVIIEEAGGRFTDFSGGPVFARGDYNLEAVSSSGQFHEEALRAFAR